MVSIIEFSLQFDWFRDNTEYTEQFKVVPVSIFAFSRSECRRLKNVPKAIDLNCMYGELSLF